MKSAEGAEKLKKLLVLQPNIITNDRLHPDFPGDTRTPEQAVPERDAVDGQNWETCMTMSGSWGFKKNDNGWKSSSALIRNLVKIAARGGNYLLNIGPKPDGTFPEESVQRLKEIGLWMKVNGEAIYGTKASPLNSLSWGECTMKEVKNNTILYLSVFDWPKDGILSVPELKNKVLSVKLLATGTTLKSSVTSDGLNIHIPGLAPDPNVNVIRLDVKGKVGKATGLNPKKKMQTGALD
jgi:alpha-L-fucosidase